MEYIRPLDGTLPSEFQKRNEEPAKIAEQDGFSELSDADAADGAKVFEPEDNSKDTPTIDELEAKAKNGEPVAIMDIIAANEAEKVKKGKTPSKMRHLRKSRQSKSSWRKQRRRQINSRKNPKRSKMRLWRFKLCVSLNVDIINSLRRIMNINTEHYKNDFFLDVDTIHTAALSDSAEDKYLLFMSRLNRYILLL